MSRYRAAAVIVHASKLLVIKRNNHGHRYYALPGGGVELGETPAQAVVREIKEETGFNCEVVRQVYEHRYDSGDRHFFFLCQVNNPGKPRLAPDSPEALYMDPSDTIEPMWLPLSKLPVSLLYPLEIRDWIEEDLKSGFRTGIRVDNIELKHLRQTL